MKPGQPAVRKIKEVPKVLMSGAKSDKSDLQTVTTNKDTSVRKLLLGTDGTPGPARSKANMSEPTRSNEKAKGGVSSFAILLTDDGRPGVTKSGTVITAPVLAELFNSEELPECANAGAEAHRPKQVILRSVNVKPVDTQSGATEKEPDLKVPKTVSDRPRQETACGDGATSV